MVWEVPATRGAAPHTGSAQAAGPDPTPLIAALATSTHPHLAAAATATETWLVTLAAQITAPDSDSIDPATEALLADIAAYRQRWAVTTPFPLGDGALDLDQADHRTLLTLAINHAHDRPRSPQPRHRRPLDRHPVRPPRRHRTSLR